MRRRSVEGSGTAFWRPTTNLAAIEVGVRCHVTDNGQTSIERTLTLRADLPDEQRDRLADIAERTPVTQAVRAGTPITTTVRRGLSGV